MPGFTLQTTIEIDGSPLDPSLEPLVEQVTVDQYLHQPDMVTVTFRDVERRAAADARVKIGSRLKISASAVGGQASGVLAVAEVVAIEAEYTVSGSRTTVRGYDPAHRFQRGRRTETYLGMKDSDIARKVAQRAGVEVGTIEESKAVLPYVAQVNETDWAFLERRSRAIGFELAVIEGKFQFRSPTRSKDAPSGGDYDSTDPLQLVLGQELLEFHARVTSAEQVGEVVARGWDMKTKQAVVGRAKATAGSASLSSSPASLADVFGKPVFTSVDRPTSTQADADALAAAHADRIGSAFAEASGTALGNPKLKAGTAVNVSVVAEEFAGKYVITSARHVFGQDGYRTHFVVSGRLDRSALGLATAGSAR